MADLEQQFHEAMFGVYRGAKTECGYNAVRFLEMLNQHRGLPVAKMLLASSDAQYGFEKLWECGRLDLTVECLVLNARFRSLFEEHELAEARRRLKALGFDPARCEA